MPSIPIARGGLLTLLEIEYLSPLLIIDSLPATLQGDYQTADQWRIVAGFGLPSVAVVLLAMGYFARKDL